MSENKTGIGDGILRGLKKIIFTSDQQSQGGGKVIPPPASRTPVQALADKPVSSAISNVNDLSGAAYDKERRLRVYQLLEKMNKPGCDFFEVWNASVEMGGANSNNIKAAYT